MSARRERDADTQPALTAQEQVVLADIKHIVRTSAPGFYWRELFHCPCGFHAQSVSLMLVHARDCTRCFLHGVERVLDQGEQQS